MTDREKIELAAWRAVRGEIITTRTPGFCLKFVRQVVEHAMGWPDRRLYDYVTSWVAPDDYPRSEGHWARDLERDLRAFGMGLAGDRVRGGDILCNFNAAPSERWGVNIGHVAIALEPDLIVEVVDPKYRARELSAGGLCLSPRESWTPTTVIRFDSAKLPALASGGR